jgi:hypothetical protein
MPLSPANSDALDAEFAGLVADLRNAATEGRCTAAALAILLLFLELAGQLGWRPRSGQPQPLATGDIQRARRVAAPAGRTGDAPAVTAVSPGGPSAAPRSRQGSCRRSGRPSTNR